MTDSTDTASQAPDLEDLNKLKTAYDNVREQIGKVIVGQEDVIEQLLVSIFARGHCILEGVPGLAKTLLVSTLAKSLSLDFTRVQFTPDLMPSDITGTEVIEENKSTGHREFKFVHGPVFTNFLLADEINRTPPKTQAALLEGMQERQVSAGGKRYALPDPFFVLATQNPIEQEGTYPLPEAQLDRFFMKVFVDYPTPEEEKDIYKMMTGAPVGEPEPVLGGEEVIHLQKTVRRVPINDLLLDYVMRFIRATRYNTDDAPDFIKRWLLWGAGPRGGQALIMAAKTRAALQGRPEVSIEDLHAMAVPVLRHRLVINYNAEAEGETTDSVIKRLIDTIPVGGDAAASDKAVQRTLTS
ncbi:MAG: MoxR family ATPase [Phycisphaeraceae bacterium]|nr:MoxR family ATPase [Phycisphaeraceae bacterium]